MGYRQTRLVSTEDFHWNDLNSIEAVTIFEEVRLLFKAEPV
jgi:hypothetical protein